MPFLNEMAEQPNALETLISRWPKQSARVMECLNQRSGKPVVFLGMGSSYFAGLYGAWLLNQHGIPALALEASLALHDATALLDLAGLRILVSQSGESPEVLELAEQGAPGPMIGITNEPTSRLAQKAMPIVSLDAGHEEATTSKTYLNTLAVVALLSGITLEKIRPLPGVIEQLLNQTVSLPHAPSELTLIARGPSLTSAYQGALILREGATITATGFSGGGFRHGPLQWAYQRDIVLFNGFGRYLELQKGLTRDLLAQHNRVYQIGNEQSADWLLPMVPEELLPLAEVVIVERMLVEWALEKGMEPGKLAHKVSRE